MKRNTVSFHSNVASENGAPTSTPGPTVTATPKGAGDGAGDGVERAAGELVGCGAFVHAIDQLAGLRPSGNGGLGAAGGDLDAEHRRHTR